MVDLGNKEVRMTGTLDGPDGRRRLWPVATVFARLVLAAGFLSAVADRFGLWGAAGTGNVFWGDWDAFLTYLKTLAPYLPDTLVDVTGWAVTVAELVLSLTLLLGAALRWSSLASAALLLIFGMSMFVFAGFEAPLSASVFSAAAAALLLSLAPDGACVLCLDRLRSARP
jgi:uncharacterized membrane protein YphA (DoxX/SURF4 family)